MADLETLRRRICEHPAFQGGPADEDYWLDFLEFTLAKFGTYDFMVEHLADWCERRPEMLYAYIITSKRDRLAWDVLHVLVPRLRTGGKALPPVLAEWWIDATTGVLVKPNVGGKPVHRNTLRDATIASAVNGIHDVTDLPYEFDATKSESPRSACHTVAGRLGMRYGTVRTIWLKHRQLVERARLRGLVPPPRPRERRR